MDQLAQIDQIHNIITVPRFAYCFCFVTVTKWPHNMFNYVVLDALSFLYLPDRFECSQFVVFIDNFVSQCNNVLKWNLTTHWYIFKSKAYDLKKIKLNFVIFLVDLLPPHPDLRLPGPSKHNGRTGNNLSMNVFLVTEEAALCLYVITLERNWWQQPNDNNIHLVLFSNRL